MCFTKSSKFASEPTALAIKAIDVYPIPTLWSATSAGIWQSESSFLNTELSSIAVVAGANIVRKKGMEKALSKDINAIQKLQAVPSKLGQPKCCQFEAM